MWFAFFLGLLFSLICPCLAVAEPESEPELELESEPEESRRFVIPIFYTTPETGLAGGLMWIQNFGPLRDGRTSHVTSVASLTVKGQSFVNVRPKLYSRHGIGEFSGSLSYRYYPSLYFGRTVDTAVLEGEPYVERSFEASLSHLWNFHDAWALRWGLHGDRREILEMEAGGLVATETAAVAQRIQDRQLVLGLERDDRDYPQAPREGSFFRVGVTKSSPRDLEARRDLPDSSRWDLEGRRYWRLAPEWVLAAQAQVSEIEGDQIPFHSLLSIGGGARLRGFYAGRYRDMALGLAQSEVRWEFRDRLTLTAGAATGRLASRVKDLSFGRDLVSGTVGIHYTVDPRNRTKIRADVGFAEKAGFYLLLGEAF